MVTILPGPEDARTADPADWPAQDPSELTPEAVSNEADDLAAALPDEVTPPQEADEADVMDQRREVEFDEDEAPDSL